MNFCSDSPRATAANFACTNTFDEIRTVIVRVASFGFGFFIALTSNAILLAKQQ